MSGDSVSLTGSTEAHGMIFSIYPAWEVIYMGEIFIPGEMDALVGREYVPGPPR